MNHIIYNPLEEYEKTFQSLHGEQTRQFFDRLVQQSGVDVAQNRETVRLYGEHQEYLAKLNKKLKWRRFWRVLMCITIVLIPVVIWVLNPKMRALKATIEEADKHVNDLLEQAHQQMLPLNRLFTDRDALQLIEDTLPLMRFEPFFSVQQEEDMRVNYDFGEQDDAEQSTTDMLAGHYNDNPFLFENKVVHTMGTQTYHGSKTIYWTETYTDSDGKRQTRQRSETLHASVTKPKPYYNSRVVLNYCAQGGPELSFTRDAEHLEQKSDRALERHIKRGEKKLKKMTDKAIKSDSDFMSMSNSEFEVLFDALDRTNEVQFRTLFTPLAQTNLVALIRSKTGYGDDFQFLKHKRTNRILSDHSQGRGINLLPSDYISHSFDTIQENFIEKNAEFFRAVYFDFAPLLAIPLYQERPVHSLKPIPDSAQTYSLKESEALANAAHSHYVVHPDTKTQAILKSAFIRSADKVDEICVTAYSYDIEKRVEYVSVHGGDGHWHDVPVEWDLYLPLEARNAFRVATTDITAAHHSVIAQRNGLCLFQ